MPISFSCPGCGKAYELPSTSAGKKARCKACRSEFAVPAPTGPLDLGPSGTIKIARIIEPPRPSAIPVARVIEPPRSSAIPRADPIETPPPAPVPRPVEVLGPPATPTKRPRWLIPAVASAGIAALLALNVGLFFAFAGKPAEAPVEVVAAPARPAPTIEAAIPAGPPVSIARPAEGPRDGSLTTADIVSRHEPSVALIRGRKGSGTGFLAGPGILATNAHVIDGERFKDIEVRFPSADRPRQGPYTARLLHLDRERDLALLGVATDLPPVVVADAYRFRKGEDVTVIGNPGVGGKMVLENAISRGIVSSMANINNQVFLQLGIAINPGNSGGPVFDPQGRVIGVVTLKTARQEGLAFAIPAEDLQSALAKLTGRGPSDDRPTAPSGGGVPALAYAWKAGQTYVYSIEVAIDTGATRVVSSGHGIYRVKSVDADGITMGHRGWIVTTRRGKDGRALPGGVSGPNQSNEIELKIDTQGNVLKSSGSSPLSLLGDFAMLMIEPLPDEPRKTWDDSRTIALREVEQVPGAVGDGLRLGRPGLDNLPGGPRPRVGPRSRINTRPGARTIGPPPRAQPQPQAKVTMHEADEETSYALGELEGDKIPIRKNYELSTREMVGDEPRLKMTGQGTISFDVKAGVPLAMDYRMNVVETATHVTYRVPIQVACKLLEGRDREKALRPPELSTTAMNPIDDGGLTKILADLKATDLGRRREAGRVLYDSAPIEGRRGEVARLLERMALDRDPGARSDAVKALGIWGDGRSVDALIAALRDESFGARDEVFEALARLSPTEKAAEAIVGRLVKDPNRARRALRAIGPPAEGPLLRVVEEGTDLASRLEACRALREVGTSQGMPALEKIARLKQDGEIGRVAEEAIREIGRRWPGDDEWESILRQARSPDGGRRQEAADRLMKSEPNPARRDEVARALESLAADVDGGTQSMALRALGSWGDPKSRPVLIGRLEDPDPRPVREAIDALGKLGPDERAARAIAGRLDRERGAAIEALAAMGPVAERAAIARLAGTKDVFLRSDLCKLLGRIGTDASLPALRQAAQGPNPEDARRVLKDLEARVRGERPSDALAALKSADRFRRGEAIQQFAALAPSAAARAEVARALDPLWDLEDVFVKKPLREAVVAWGDDRSADALADRLARPDFKEWQEAMQALVTLRPDARTAEILTDHFARDPRLVLLMAKPMAAQAERPLLAIARAPGEPRIRIEACRAVGSIGTPASVPDLRALARRAGDAQLAGEAEEALKSIAARQ